MKRLILFAGAVALSVGWVAMARADGLPWQKNPTDQPATPTETGGPEPCFADEPGTSPDNPHVSVGLTPPSDVDLEKELPPLLYSRAIRPILAARDAAAKQEDLCQKEMSKDESKRDLRLILSYKERAAKSYLIASVKAKQAVTLVPKPEHKAAVTTRFEKPLQNKAAETYLEMADTYATHRDIRMAVAYYRRVLQVDPDNLVAKQQLEKIKKNIEQAMIDRRNADQPPRSSGGGDDIFGLDFAPPTVEEQLDDKLNPNGKLEDRLDPYKKMQEAAQKRRNER